MKTSVLTCTLFIVLHTVYGSKMKTVDEWTTKNDLETDLYPSNGKLYQARAFHQKLIIRSIERVNPVYCTTMDRRIDHSTTRPWGIKHLGNGKTLVVFDTQIIVLDTKSCTIKSVVSTECKIVFPRQDSFDCYPPKILDNFTKRFSDNGELIDAVGINTVYYGFGEYAEFERPTENRSYFMWEITSHENSLTVLKTANSSYGIVRKDYLNFQRTKYFSLAHDNFTGCVPWFNYGNGDFIECVMVDWSVGPTRNVTFEVSPPVEAKEGRLINQLVKQKIAVLNLPAGGAILIYNRESVHQPSKRVYYRIVDAQGRASDKEALFYEFEKLDSYDIGLHLYEKDDSVCGVMADKGEIVTKCVKWEDEVTGLGVWGWVKNAVSRIFSIFK